MSYVEGLSAALNTIGQIEETFASLPSAASNGGFAAVMAQIAALSGPASQEASPLSRYGWPLEEGRRFQGMGAPAEAGAPGTVSSEVMASSLSATTGGAGLWPNATTLFGASPETAGLGEKAVAEAESFLGVPYLWGGTDPSVGVDCSGLVQDVYAAIGISLPRTSQEQAMVGAVVPSLADAQPGDLVFYPGSDGTAASPGHVGIYIGNGQMIDAPYTGAKVRIDPVGSPTEIRRVTGLASGLGEASGTSYAAALEPAATSAGASGAAQYEGDFSAAAATYGVPEQLLSAVAETESNYQPTALSSAGAEGLMQLMPSTAASLGVDPWDPPQAIAGAARLLAAYYNQYGSWPVALAAYNAGPGAVQHYGGVPPYPETQAYVQAVLGRAGMEDQ